ncbi:molybdopterin-synthase adenylyltransferase [mine drainage metagenome]|uniref:Molybdopterin-synthase adenylyltransferase n=1 Tax=mine drainage metagenome TaxID=410659 RepID=A0A1J5QAP8_9ZZZZ
MIELILAAEDAATVRSALTGGKTEGCAVLYTSQTTRSDGTVRLLVRQVELAALEDYTRQGPLEAELRPDFVACTTKRARREQLGLVFVHSHPGGEAPNFSAVDDRGEERIAAFLAHRHPDRVHAALVVSIGGMRARRLGTVEDVRVVALGAHREVIFDPSLGAPDISDMFDRQVRAFGSAGQAAIQRLRIAIVGLGGTGSLVAQQLAHLGVRDFILVDPDVLEKSNLNRVSNATSSDIGSPKIDIAARYVQSVVPDATVARIQGDIIRARVARELLNADFIFGCTDSHGSRAVMQQVSYQYLIPCIDMGTTIAVAADKVTHIYGRVQLLAPGHACFTCDGLLNGNEVRRDMMTKFERQADPYLRGAREPAPAVISINGTVASLGVTMLLSMTAGVPVGARHLLYNAMASTLRSVRAKPIGDCIVCSRKGAFARGDAWPLQARQD